MKLILEEEIRRWPKAELHVHLDTSVNFDAVNQICSGQFDKQTYKDTFVAPQRCKDLHEFLLYVEPTIELLQDRQSITIAFTELLKAQKKDGVIYTEIRMAPLLHTRKTLSPTAVAETVCNALQAGIVETGIEARLIFCTMRHFTHEQGMETAKLAVKFKHRGVVGFDLAGDEAGFPIRPHVKAFQFAEAHQLSLTAHCGEALGPESVMETLDILQPNRIGHGVRSIENQGLFQKLRMNQMHLEICPSSNLQTGVFSVMRAHSLNELYQQGISISINTDGRSLTSTDLTNEYLQIYSTFHWSKEDFKNVNLNAIQAAFCEDALKEILKGKMMNGYK